MDQPDSKHAKKQGEKLEVSCFTYYSLGESYRMKNQFQTAIGYYVKALEIAKEHEYKQYEIGALFGLGHAYRLDNKFQTAIDYYAKALEVAKECKDKRKETKALVELGGAYRLNNQFQAAIGHYKKALEIAREHECKPEETQALFGLGDAYGSIKQYQTAIEYYKKALDIARRIKHTEAERKALLCLGNYYKLSNQFQNAIQCIEESLQIGKGPADRNQETMAKNSMKGSSVLIGANEERNLDDAVVFQERKPVADLDRHEDANKNLQTSDTSDVAQQQNTQHKNVDNVDIDIKNESIRIAEKGDQTELRKDSLFIMDHPDSKHSKEEGEELEESCFANLSLGECYRMENQFQTAIGCYVKALEIAKEHEYKQHEIAALFGLGHAYRLDNEIQTSIDYYAKALEIAKECKDKREETEALVELGRAYRLNNQFPAAIRHYKKALEIAREHEYKQLETESLVGLGDVCKSNNQFRTAIRHYEEVLEIAKKHECKLEETQALFGLGDAYGSINQYQTAIEYYKKALKIARRIKHTEAERKSLLCLGHYYKLNNQFQNSIQCIEESLQIEERPGDRKHGTTAENTMKSSSIILVCSENGEHEASVRWYKKALDIFGTELNDELRRNALDGLAVAWFNLGYTEKAIEPIQEAKNISEKEYNADRDEAKIPQEQKNCTDQKPSSSQVPAEWLKSAEETCNPTSTKKLPKEHKLCLKKCIEEFSASNVYTISASSKAPLNEKIRKSMSADVKSSAYKNLLSPNEDRHSGNDGKFVSDDQQILNFATEDVGKNTATAIPARLFKTLGKNMKSIGQISCGQIQGTCWLVADMLVITNVHVYMSFIKERIDHPNLNLPITVKFDYFHPGKGEQVEVEVDEEQDPQLESFPFDYKVLRLKEDEGLGDRKPLGPLVRSCPLQEGLVIIVGHPAGKEMHQETCVVVCSHSWRQKLQDRQDFKHSQMNNEDFTRVHMTNNDLLLSQSHKFQEQGCLPYDTSLFSGASGSPVFNLNGNIVAMHTQGYILNTGEEKWSLMEFGVQFNAICKDMKERYIEPNVVKKLFPDCDLENMDIDN